MKTKKLVREILIILVISIILGILYNLYSSKPISLIRYPKVYESVTDSLINSMFEASNPMDTTVQAKPNKIDTIKPQKEIIKDSATKVSKVEKLEPETKITYKEITYDLVKKYLNNPNVIIIDARPPEKYQKEHIGNAINLYPEQEDENAYFSKLVALPQDKVIIVYCDGGQCDLSHHVVNDLINFKFKKVMIYLGGWEDWQQKSGQ
jgi:rhodanese-related sulfurtransferase